MGEKNKKISFSADLAQAEDESVKVRSGKPAQQSRTADTPNHEAHRPRPT